MTSLFIKMYVIRCPVSAGLNFRGTKLSRMTVEPRNRESLVPRKLRSIRYVVHMHDCRKKNRIFHVNMLRKWQVREPTDTGYWCEEVLETSEDDLPVWGGNDGSTLTEAQLAGRLSQDQCAIL